MKTRKIYFLATIFVPLLLTYACSPSSLGSPQATATSAVKASYTTKWHEESHCTLIVEMEANMDFYAEVNWGDGRPVEGSEASSSVRGADLVVGHPYVFNGTYNVHLTMYHLDHRTHMHDYVILDESFPVTAATCWPTPTPFSTPASSGGNYYQACQGAPGSQIQVGMSVSLMGNFSTMDSVGQGFLFTDPGNNSSTNTSFFAIAGPIWTVLHGPECTDNQVWWQIQDRRGNTGWAYEAMQWPNGSCTYSLLPGEYYEHVFQEDCHRAP